VTLPVAILAGGRARRLDAVTKAIPKSMVDVAGKPFIARQLEYLRRQGVERAVLCVGHFAEQIEAYVGAGSAFELDVRYSHDGPRLMGTGGALRRALPLLGDEFFVLYGDSHLPIDFTAVERDFRARGCPALITVLRNQDRWDSSNVAFEDGTVLAYSKKQPTEAMKHIDYGLGILSASVVATVDPEAPVDLGDVYEDLARRGLLAGHEVFTRFYEIGSHAGLAETIHYFAHESHE
jgi:NDP-sugar pyrophosphorylase family protein